MRIVSIACLCLLVSAAVATGSEQPKISIEAKDMPIKDLASELSKQTGTTIVVDPKVQGSVTLNLKDATLDQALDAVAKLKNVVWKKLQFAKPSDEPVKLDQIKSAMIILASLPLVAFSAEDPVTKTVALAAKDLPAAPETSSVKLPEGYSWVTVYVILGSEPSREQAATSTGTGPIKFSNDIKERTLQLAKMTPDERRQILAAEIAAEMSLAPEIRRAILADRMKAMFGMDPKLRDQYREDMHAIFHQLREENPDFGRR
ncbi:MAG: secretin and TonB N-terminal domain-containing protein [Armatimonadota bacterium]